VEFSEFSVDKNVGVIFEPCYTCIFTVVILHTFINNSDNGSFRNCIVSHCVQMCLSYFFSSFCFLLFLCFFFFVALAANKDI